MGPLVWGIVIALVIGIAYLSSDVEKKDRRKKHLEGLRKLLNAEQEEIAGRSNSYVLRFEYRNVLFRYEDIEDKVFDKITYHGFLRVDLPVHFNVVFTENVKSAFRSSAASLAQSSRARGTNHVESPRGFKEFSIFSNRPDVTQRLFEDEAVERVLAKFKNKDVRGKPELALEIVDGVLVMKFYPLGRQLEPTIFDLRNNVSLIEDYLEDLLIIYRRVEKIAEDLPA